MPRHFEQWRRRIGGHGHAVQSETTNRRRSASLPSRSLISCENVSTFVESMTRAGISMNLLAGITDLLPLCSSLRVLIDLIAILIRILHDGGDHSCHP